MLWFFFHSTAKLCKWKTRFIVIFTFLSYLRKWITRKKKTIEYQYNKCYVFSLNLLLYNCLIRVCFHAWVWLKSMAFHRHKRDEIIVCYFHIITEKLLLVWSIITSIIQFRMKIIRKFYFLLLVMCVCVCFCMSHCFTS